MDNEPLKSVPIVKKKPQSIKITALFLIMLITLIGIALYISGLFGPEFLKFFMFMLLFLLPVLVTFRNVFLLFLPEFIKNNLSIVDEDIDNKKNEYDPIKKINIETKRNDYLIMTVCLFCVIGGVFLLNGNKNTIDEPIQVSDPVLQTATKPSNTPNLPPVKASNSQIPKVLPPINFKPLTSNNSNSSQSSNAPSSNAPSSLTGGAMNVMKSNESNNYSNLRNAVLFVFLGLYISSQSL